MKLKPYSQYRDSGVDWLGKIPQLWDVKRLKHLGEAIIGLTYDPSQVVDEANGTLVLRSSNVQEGQVTFDDNVFVSTAIPENLVTRLGDILICSRNGSRALIGKNAIINSAAAGLTFGAFMTIYRSELNPYLYWVFNSQLFKFQSGAFLTSTINQLTVGNLYSFEVPLPPNSDRDAITIFLDRETAKIDTLIAKHEKLIELLKEKRQAVISHAVTKGLDPTVPMKPSGVEWLGDVPEHWGVMRLKHDVDFVTSGSRGWAEHYADSGDLFIRIGNLTRDSVDLDLSDIQYVDVPNGAEGERTRVRDGDILVSITAYLGSVAVVPGGVENAYVSQHVALARPAKRKFLPRWAAYVILSNSGKRHFDAQGYGGTKVQLSLDDVKQLPVPVPPLSEQEEIISYCDATLNKIDLLVEKARSAITLQKEHRTALISAAVTGKIDVRDAVSDLQEAA